MALLSVHNDSSATDNLNRFFDLLCTLALTANLFLQTLWRVCANKELSQLYLACYLHLIPFPAKVQDEVIPVVSTLLLLCRFYSCKVPSTDAGLSQLPFWALVSFGAYLLFKLGWGVFSFNDVPAAYSELMKEIQIARADLRSKGVDVD